MDRRITLRGADRDYVLLLDTNAQCRIEDVTGLMYPMVLDAIRRGHRTVLRQWVRASLIDPPEQTLDQVGAIIDDVGGYEVLTAGFQQAKQAARKARRGK